MTARNVLAIIVSLFFVVALLVIYNAFYNPVSTSGTGLPAVTDQN
ncbi:hypothetical protein [Rhizobium sp. Leaf391]|nr:hypothetical protein [Rhizobium sp. Leaf391]